MKRPRWPFDDYQPVGLTDLLLSGMVTGMVIWPPFLGVLQCWGSVEAFPLPFTAALFARVVFILMATGAALGLLCGLALVVGLYYRKPWIRRLGPYAAAALLVGAEAWALPGLFPDLNAAWREEAFRVLTGVALSVPAAWASVAITLKTAAVHTHRDELRRVVPPGL